MQRDHLHLIAEGKNRQDLSAQMRTLFSRIALAVNYIARRRGRLFRDRHHRSELSNPTKARNALVYVLFNERKHHAQNGGALSTAYLSELDDKSSVAWLDARDWNPRARPPPDLIARLRATTPACWLKSKSRDCSTPEERHPERHAKEHRGRFRRLDEIGS